MQRTDQLPREAERDTRTQRSAEREGDRGNRRGTTGGVIGLPGSGGLQVRLVSRSPVQTGNGQGWAGWEEHEEVVKGGRGACVWGRGMWEEGKSGVGGWAGKARGP